MEFAGIWRDMPKIVFSKTLMHADWNTTVVRDVVPEEIMKLRKEEASAKSDTRHPSVTPVDAKVIRQPYLSPPGLRTPHE